MNCPTSGKKNAEDVICRNISIIRLHCFDGSCSHGSAGASVHLVESALKLLFKLMLNPSLKLYSS